jgi:hypothetical protein
MATPNDGAEASRAKYRREHIGLGYSGWGHFESS